MKAIKILLLLILSVTFFGSCRKDPGLSSSANAKPSVKIEDLSIKSTFDWKTVKDYQLTLSGSASRTLQVVSTDGSVYYKSLLPANTPTTVTVTLPAFEQNVHLVYNGQNVVLPLTAAALTYSFK